MADSSVESHLDECEAVLADHQMVCLKAKAR